MGSSFAPEINGAGEDAGIAWAGRPKAMTIAAAARVVFSMYVHPVESADAVSRIAEDTRANAGQPDWSIPVPCVTGL